MFLYIRIVFVLLFSYFEQNSCEVPPADRAGTLGERISGEDAQRVFLASCDCHCQGYPVIRWTGIVAEQVDRSMTDEIMLIMGTKAPQQQQQPKQQYPIPIPSPESRVSSLAGVTSPVAFDDVSFWSCYPAIPLSLPLGLYPSILVGHLASRHAAFVSALQILMRSDIYVMLYTFHAI